MLRKHGSMDMTEGVIWKQLLGFAVPLMLGFVFQQLYNTVDSVVVGNFVGKEALAAVGSTGNIINTLIGFFTGLSTGATVVIARMFGARDREGVHNAVHTTMVMTLVLALVFTVIGVLMTPQMLKWMNTPKDVLPQAEEYLRIYFSGIIGLMIYNMGAGILRAVGDSRRPLYFLIFSAIVNTVGDLVFVLVFDMKIAGVALATILSQILSAILVCASLMHAQGDHRLILRRLRIHWPTLKLIFKIGLPAAIQSAVTAFSNVFVQAYINAYGSACMAGWSIYGKLDQLALLPMQSISMASSTFVSQNLGAQNIPRAKRGIRTALGMSLLSTAVLMLPLMCFSKTLLSFFNQNEEVLRYGSMFVLWISPFYLFCCVNDILAGALRGAGDSKGPMIFMLLSYVVLRQIYLFFISKAVHSVLPIGLGYPLGWLLCAIMQTIYYLKSGWEKKQANVT